MIKAAGGAVAYVDGSFVTGKEVPNDFDVCWDPNGVDLGMMDPVLLDFDNARANQKAKYGGEFFPSTVPADRAGRAFLEFFQTDKSTGRAKGIIGIDLLKAVL